MIYPSDKSKIAPGSSENSGISISTELPSKKDLEKEEKIKEIEILKALEKAVGIKDLEKKEKIKEVILEEGTLKNINKDKYIIIGEIEEIVTSKEKKEIYEKISLFINNKKYRSFDTLKNTKKYLKEFKYAINAKITPHKKEKNIINVNDNNINIPYNKKMTFETVKKEIQDAIRNGDLSQLATTFSFDNLSDLAYELGIEKNSTTTIYKTSQNQIKTIDYKSLWNEEIIKHENYKDLFNIIVDTIDQYKNTSIIKPDTIKTIIQNLNENLLTPESKQIIINIQKEKKPEINDTKEVMCPECDEYLDIPEHSMITTCPYCDAIFIC